VAADFRSKTGHSTMQGWPLDTMLNDARLATGRTASNGQFKKGASVIENGAERSCYARSTAVTNKNG